MTEVFVSYASKDRAAALPIIETISQAGLKIWTGEATLSESVAKQLQGEIETARCLVVLWSKAATESEFLQREIHHAIRAWSSDRLVLATLDNAPLPVGLRDLSAIPIRNPNDSGTKQLVERAQAIVGRDRTRLASPIERPETSFARSTHSRRSWRIIAAALVVGFAVLAGLATWYSLFSFSREPPRPELAPKGSFPRGPFPTSPSVPLILVLLALGAAIGAGTVWVWTTRSRLRSNRTPSVALSRQAPETSNNTPQVFVSYSHQDERTVEQLVQQIEQLGYAIWIDRQSTGSQRYAAAIVRAIRTSRLVALMCSQNAFASDHVIREVYVAGDYKKPFIAFQLDPTELPDEVLYFVSGFPRVPVASIDRQQLRSEIARLITA